MKKIQITRHNNCYYEIDSLCITFQALAIAFEYSKHGTINFSEGDYMTIDGIGTKQSISIPISGPIETALQNKKPDIIELQIKETDSFIGGDIYVHVIKHVFNFIIAPLIVSFYENNFAKARAKFGSDFSTWKSSWQMGWVTRNALSHNKCIFFKNLAHNPITWNNVSISPANQNTPLENLVQLNKVCLLGSLYFLI